MAQCAVAGSIPPTDYGNSVAVFYAFATSRSRNLKQFVGHDLTAPVWEAVHYTSSTRLANGGPACLVRRHFSRGQDHSVNAVPSKVLQQSAQARIQSIRIKPLHQARVAVFAGEIWRLRIEFP